MNIDSSVLTLMMNKELVVSKESGSISSFPRFPLANLKVGEMIDAKILEILGETLLIESMGEKFYAKSNINFRENQEIKIVYQGIEKGQISFKILSGDGDFNSNYLERAIENLGVKVNEKVVFIAKELIQNKLPVTKENIALIEKAITLENFQSQPKYIDTDVQEGTQAKAQQNIQNNIREGTQGKVQQDSQQGSQQDMQGKVQENIHPRGQENVVVSKQVAEQVKIATLLMKDNFPVTKDLVDMVMSNSRESNVVKELEVLENSLKSLKGLVAAEIENEGASKAQNQELLKGLDSLVKEMTLKAADGDLKDLPVTIQKIVEGKTPLKLLELMNKLNGSNVKEDLVEPSTREIRDNIVNLVKGFAKETLVNTQSNNSLDLNNVYLNIPFKVDKQWYPASLQIKTEGEGGEEINLDKAVYITVAVETKNLSKVTVKLDMVKKKVNCKILVENDSGYRVFSEHKEELEKALGKDFDSINVKVYKDEPFSEIEGDITPSNKFKLNRIDFRV